MSQAWASTSIQLDQRLMRALKSILPTTLSSSPTTRSSSWKERDQGKKPSITLTSGQNSITQELRKAIKGARVEPLSIWHQRFGHLNNKSLLKMASMGSVKGLALFKDQPYSSDHCRRCLQENMCRAPFMSTSTKTTGVGQVIRSDVCGPMQVSTLTGECYYVVFTYSTTVKINWHFFRQMDLFQPSQWRHSTLTHQFDDSANSQSYGKYCNYIVCQKFFIWFNLPLNYVNPKFCTSYWTWATPFGHSN